MDSLGIRFELNDLRQAMDAADIDGNQEIDFDEFVNMLGAFN